MEQPSVKQEILHFTEKVQPHCRDKKKAIHSFHKLCRDKDVLLSADEALLLLRGQGATHGLLHAIGNTHPNSADVKHSSMLALHLLVDLMMLPHMDGAVAGQAAVLTPNMWGSGEALTSMLVCLDPSVLQEMKLDRHIMQAAKGPKAAKLEAQAQRDAFLVLRLLHNKRADFDAGMVCMDPAAVALLHKHYPDLARAKGLRSRFSISMPVPHNADDKAGEAQRKESREWEEEGDDGDDSDGERAERRHGGGGGGGGAELPYVWSDALEDQDMGVVRQLFMHHALSFGKPPSVVFADEEDEEGEGGDAGNEAAARAGRERQDSEARKNEGEGKGEGEGEGRGGEGRERLSKRHSKQTRFAACQVEIPALVALQPLQDDPLGFGQLDMNTLRLVQPASLASPLGMRHRALSFESQPMTSRRRSTVRLTSVRQGAAMVGGGAVEGWSKAIANSPASPEFDAAEFLRRVYRHEAFHRLQRGRETLKERVQDHAGKLKTLVKEHSGLYIQCKSLINEMHSNVIQRGLHVDNSELQQLVRRQSDLHQLTKRMFGPLFDRKKEEDVVRQALRLVSNNHSLVGVPTRMRQALERGEYDRVVWEYRRALTMRSAAASAPNVLVDKVLQSVEGVVAEMEKRLVVELKEPLELSAALGMPCEGRKPGRLSEGGEAVPGTWQSKQEHVRRLLWLDTALDPGWECLRAISGNGVRLIGRGDKLLWTMVDAVRGRSAKGLVSLRSLEQGRPGHPRARPGRGRGLLARDKSVSSVHVLRQLQSETTRVGMRDQRTKEELVVASCVERAVGVGFCYVEALWTIARAYLDGNLSARGNDAQDGGGGGGGAGAGGGGGGGGRDRREPGRLHRTVSRPSRRGGDGGTAKLRTREEVEGLVWDVVCALTEQVENMLGPHPVDRIPSATPSLPARHHHARSGSRVAGSKGGGRELDEALAGPDAKGRGGGGAGGGGGAKAREREEADKARRAQERESLRTFQTLDGKSLQAWTATAQVLWLHSVLLPMQLPDKVIAHVQEFSKGLARAFLARLRDAVQQDIHALVEAQSGRRGTARQDASRRSRGASREADDKGGDDDDDEASASERDRLNSTGLQDLESEEDDEDEGEDAGGGGGEGGAGAGEGEGEGGDWSDDGSQGGSEKDHDRYNGSPPAGDGSAGCGHNAARDGASRRRKHGSAASLASMEGALGVYTRMVGPLLRWMGASELLAAREGLCQCMLACLDVVRHNALHALPSSSATASGGGGGGVGGGARRGSDAHGVARSVPVAVSLSGAGSMFLFGTAGLDSDEWCRQTAREAHGKRLVRAINDVRWLASRVFPRAWAALRKPTQVVGGSVVGQGSGTAPEARLGRVHFDEVVVLSRCLDDMLVSSLVAFHAHDLGRCLRHGLLHAGHKWHGEAGEVAREREDGSLTPHALVRPYVVGVLTRLVLVFHALGELRTPADSAPSSSPQPVSPADQQSHAAAALLEDDPNPDPGGGGDAHDHDDEEEAIARRVQEEWHPASVDKVMERLVGTVFTALLRCVRELEVGVDEGEGRRVAVEVRFLAECTRRFGGSAVAHGVDAVMDSLGQAVGHRLAGERSWEAKALDHARQSTRAQFLCLRQP